MKLPNGKPLPSGVLTSLRIAPPIFGLGLLESIPDETLLSLSAREHGNGIRGHVNFVWDVEKNTFSIGRFGWKANNVNLIQQSAGAYFNDMWTYPDLTDTDYVV